MPKYPRYEPLHSVMVMSFGAKTGQQGLGGGAMELNPTTQPADSEQGNEHLKIGQSGKKSLNFV